MRRKINLFLAVFAAAALCSCEQSSTEKKESNDTNAPADSVDVTPKPAVKADDISQEVENTSTLVLEPGMRPIRNVSPAEMSSLLGYELVDLGANYNGLITVGEDGKIDGQVSIKTTQPKTRSFCHYDGECVKGLKMGIWDVNRKMGEQDTRYTMQITFEKDQCRRSAFKGVFDIKSQEFFEYYVDGGKACDVDAVAEMARARWLKESEEDPKVEAEKSY